MRDSVSHGRWFDIAFATVQWNSVLYIIRCIMNALTVARADCFTASLCDHMFFLSTDSGIVSLCSLRNACKEIEQVERHVK